MSTLTRLTFWCLMIYAGLGLGLTVALVAHSLSPEPGANMVLMGLPCIAFLTAVATFGVALTVGLEGLARWERWAGVVLTGLVVACDTMGVVLAMVWKP